MLRPMGLIYNTMCLLSITNSKEENLLSNHPSIRITNDQRYRKHNLNPLTFEPSYKLSDHPSLSPSLKSSNIPSNKSSHESSVNLPLNSSKVLRTVDNGSSGGRQRSTIVPLLTSPSPFSTMPADNDQSKADVVSDRKSSNHNLMSTKQSSSSNSINEEEISDPIALLLIRPPSSSTINDQNGSDIISDSVSSDSDPMTIPPSSSAINGQSETDTISDSTSSSSLSNFDDPTSITQSYPPNSLNNEDDGEISDPVMALLKKEEEKQILKNEEEEEKRLLKTQNPSINPSYEPSDYPSLRPSLKPSNRPSYEPSRIASNKPSTRRDKFIKEFIESGIASNKPSIYVSNKPSTKSWKRINEIIDLLKRSNTPSLSYSPTIDITQAPSAMVPTHMPSKTSKYVASFTKEGSEEEEEGMSLMVILGGCAAVVGALAMVYKVVGNPFG